MNNTNIKPCVVTVRFYYGKEYPSFISKYS